MSKPTSAKVDQRQGYRNGSYERNLTTRIGPLKLEVPRDRDGTFQTELFERYQRSEKALMTTLMQMVIEGVSTRRVKDITTELCGREFSHWAVSNLTENPRANRLQLGPSARFRRSIRSSWPTQCN